MSLSSVSSWLCPIALHKQFFQLDTLQLRFHLMQKNYELLHVLDMTLLLINASVIPFFTTIWHFWHIPNLWLTIILRVHFSDLLPSHLAAALSLLSHHKKRNPDIRESICTITDILKKKKKYILSWLVLKRACPSDSKYSGWRTIWTYNQKKKQEQICILHVQLNKLVWFS